MDSFALAALYDGAQSEQYAVTGNTLVYSTYAWRVAIVRRRPPCIDVTDARRRYRRRRGV